MAYPRAFHRVLGLGLLLALMIGCGRKTDPGLAAVTAAAVPVRVAAVEQSGHTPPVRAAAELARQTEAVLAFSGPGVVESVLVRPGDRVQRGQTLARLRPDTVEAQAVQATAALEQARRNLARVERLHQERVATLELLQDARTTVETAEASLRIAEFHRTFAVISAPASGVILRRFAEANELVAAGQPVLAFAGDDEGWIARAHLSAREVARIALGSPAELDDGSGNPVAGRISRIAAAADGATRMVLVEITLQTVPAGAHSGRIVAARIYPLPVPPRQAVPLAAIREGAGERAFLFVLAPGEDVVRRVQIDIELIDDGRVFLRSPLPDGVQVVTSGTQFLRDGSRVSITN